jgi:hypothetical protein
MYQFKKFNIILIKNIFPPIILFKYKYFPLRTNENIITKSEYNLLVHYIGIQNIKHYIIVGRKYY